MNEALKARIANILTTLVAIIAVVQGSFTSPPFSGEAVFVASTIFTYIALIGTTAKQWLSPDVNNTGVKVTVFVLIAATIAGLGDLIGIVDLPAVTEQYVKWGISLAVMIVNILSKQLFPSYDQKVKMNELKKETK